MCGRWANDSRKKSCASRRVRSSVTKLAMSALVLNDVVKSHLASGCDSCGDARKDGGMPQAVDPAKDASGASSSGILAGEPQLGSA